MSNFDHRAQTRLKHATLAGDIAAMDRALNDGAKMSIGSCGGRPLRLALRHEAAALWLIARGAKPNHLELVDAIESGSVGIVQAMLGAGARVECQPGYQCGTKYHWSPLLTAVQQRNDAMVRLLIASGAKVNATCRYDSHGRRASPARATTALIEACHTGSLAVVQTLIKAGAIVNSVRDEQPGPLHIVAAGLWRGERKDECRIAMALIDAGALVDARDADGRTALHHAATVGHTEMVMTLLQRGARCDIASNSGRTPLFDAARRGASLIVAMLLDAGACVEVTLEGKTQSVRDALGDLLTPDMANLLRAEARPTLRTNGNHFGGR